MFFLKKREIGVHVKQTKYFAYLTHDPLFYAPLLKKVGVYCFAHVGRYVGRYVGTSVTFSLPLYNLVMHGGILK